MRYPLLHTLRRAGYIASHDEYEGSLSPYRRAKKAWQRRIVLQSAIKDAIFMALGIVAAGFGLKGFLLPNAFIDGGVTGISLLLAELTALTLPTLLVLINAPFIVLGYFQVGRAFALKSAVAICGLAYAVAVLPYPLITHDKLLIAVFGGFFLGLGIGFSVRGGAVIDGTEILAIYLTRKSSLSVGDVILGFNIIIFSVAAYLLSVETALYAILTYFAASKAVDFILEGIEEYTGVTIISSRSEEIRRMIIHTLRRGVTIYSGKRGFGKRGEREAEIDIIYTVITRLEVSRLQQEVDAIDPHAFVVMASIKDTKGGMIKKRPHKMLH
ncbi:MAG: YitT family protein [Bacteroidota bacterium]|nr:YitT family protein [Candidatus Kapabacteria bacterium]MDW8219925.1 YitT family protein [Bacteroidota bacterium]